MRKLIVFLATAATVLAVLAGGCGKAKAADNSTQPPASVPALEGHSLADTSWVLVSYGEPASLKSVITGTKITLSFNAATNEISGNGGVNGYGGEAVRTDNQLALSGIMHTMMASTNQAVNEQESAYFGLLNTAQSIAFGNGTLIINCEGGQVLIFNAAPITPPSSPTTCLATSTVIVPPPPSSRPRRASRRTP